MDSITLIRPDDWHVHLRDGAALKATVAGTARVFGRAIVMPNLVPPVTTTAQALVYRERILAAQQDLPRQFDPLMVLYLTDNTPLRRLSGPRHREWSRLPSSTPQVQPPIQTLESPIWRI